MVAKSLWWPGAFNFYQNQRTLQFYVGNGLKHEEQTYYPINPPLMLDDREELECWDEFEPPEEYIEYLHMKEGFAMEGMEMDDE